MRKKSLSAVRGYLTIGFCALLPLSAWAGAGFITTNEAGMDAIYSQASFGNQTIDIRFNAAQTLNNSALESIDTASEFSALVAMNSFNSRTVDMFFVDKINWCGGPATNVIGCGQQPGNVLAVDSTWAAKSVYGPALLSHELGHNLDLSHVNDPKNLMNPILFGNSLLTASQVATILNSPLVQIDAFGQRYISITPIAVVPEPDTLILMGLGLLVLGFGISRQQRRM